MLDRSLLRIQDLRDHRVIFISDIHGEKDLLEVLLEKVHYIPGQDTLFLLGDLIEKGSASLETLRWVMTLARNERVIVLKGNNDEAEQLLEDKIPLPMKLGYLRTRRSLISEMACEQGMTIDEKTDFKALRRRLTEAYAEEFVFLRDLPLIAAGPGYAAVHSSLQDAQDLTNNDPCLILKDNDFLLKSSVKFPYPVIVGHMPTVALSDRQGNCGVHFLKDRNILAIDGGCGMHAHGQLNALIVQDGNFRQFQTASADRLPRCRVLADQAATPEDQQVFVRYFESEIEVVEENNEFLRVRHKATQRLLEIPRSALRMIEGKPHCFNSTSCWLALRQGEEVAVIQTYADRSFCKMNGQLGWVGNAVLETK